jgi:hypothetical protein
VRSESAIGKRQECGQSHLTADRTTMRPSSPRDTAIGMPTATERLAIKHRKRFIQARQTALNDGKRKGEAWEGLRLGLLMQDALV